MKIITWNVLNVFCYNTMGWSKIVGIKNGNVKCKWHKLVIKSNGTIGMVCYQLSQQHHEEL